MTLGNDIVLEQPDGANEETTRRAPRAIRLALRVLLVGAICHLSTEVGFAHKFPPHNISALWPTGAILFSVLVVTPVRHWWAYTLAAYFTSVMKDVLAGFPVAAPFFIVAGILEILIAAVGVRRFAGGLRAFDSLRSLVVYLMVAVVLAPFASAFVAAVPGGTGSYWFYWRAWFLSEALAFLMLAPAILTWIGMARTPLRRTALARGLEACLLGCGLVAISVRVFHWPTVVEGSIPALVYLPLPFLLWAAVRFGPAGVNTSLLIVAFLSISGAVREHGPFAAGSPAEDVLALQMFLLVISLPLMFLAALIAERRERTNILSESQRELQILTGRLLQAQETERRRIARELHDDLNQRLALLAVELDLLGQKSPESSTQLKGRMKQLSDQVKQLSSAVHGLSHQLHPAKLEQLGLVAAVRALCTELAHSHGLPIAFAHHAVPEAICAETALCLYRIVQEALRNVIKHSDARHAAVELRGSADAICLRVADDGVGFDPRLVGGKGELGLVSMRERLRLVNGEIAIALQPAGGTQINVRVPLGAARQAERSLSAEPARI
jgi:two-component system sensor histidine kinase UhpB